MLILAAIVLICVRFASSFRHAGGVHAGVQPVPQPAPPPVRERGWALVLLPLGFESGFLTSNPLAGTIEVWGAVAIALFAPRLAWKAVPYTLLALGGYGPVLATAYQDGNATRHLYGVVLAGTNSYRTHFVLLQAAAFVAAGLWLLVRVQAPGGRQVSNLVARWRNSARGEISARQALLLIPVVGVAMQLPGPGNWFGIHAVDGFDVAVIDLAVAATALVLIFRSRAWPQRWPRLACLSSAPTAG